MRIHKYFQQGPSQNSLWSLRNWIVPEHAAPQTLGVTEMVMAYIYIYTRISTNIYIYGPESKLCMERSAVFRTYGTKGLRNWSCSGPLECYEI